MKFGTTLDITAAGLSAQDARLQVIAQNLANADSTGSTPGSNPYQRKTISFHDDIKRCTNRRQLEDGLSGSGEVWSPKQFADAGKRVQPGEVQANRPPVRPEAGLQERYDDCR